jgi:hypothetical protein
MNGEAEQYILAQLILLIVLHWLVNGLYSSADCRSRTPLLPPKAYNLPFDDDEVSLNRIQLQKRGYRNYLLYANYVPLDNTRLRISFVRVTELWVSIPGLKNYTPLQY